MSAVEPSLALMLACVPLLRPLLGSSPSGEVVSDCVSRYDSDVSHHAHVEAVQAAERDGAGDKSGIVVQQEWAVEREPRTLAVQVPGGHTARKPGGQGCSW